LPAVLLCSGISLLALVRTGGCSP